MISRFAVGAAVSLLLADVAAARAQELPSGGGPMPELRRGANGQIEVVPTHPAPRQAPGRASTSPAAPPPSGGSAPPPVRVAVPPRLPAGPLRPVIEVRPNTPRVRDTAPGGTVVARYSVQDERQLSIYRDREVRPSLLRQQWEIRPRRQQHHRKSRRPRYWSKQGHHHRSHHLRGDPGKPGRALIGTRL